MKPRATTAPVKTVSLECDMAIMAVMKNDLSPISEIMITDRDAITACTKLMSISDWSSFGPELESKLAGTYNKNTPIYHNLFISSQPVNNFLKLILFNRKQAEIGLDRKMSCFVHDIKVNIHCQEVMYIHFDIIKNS